VQGAGAATAAGFAGACWTQSAVKSVQAQEALTACLETAGRVNRQHCAGRAVDAIGQ